MSAPDQGQALVAEVTHPLLVPVTITKRRSNEEIVERIEELTVRRPKAKDLRIMDRPGGDVGKTIELLAALTGQPVKVIDELDQADMEALSAILENFTPPGRATGES